MDGGRSRTSAGVSTRFHAARGCEGEAECATVRCFSLSDHRNRMKSPESHHIFSAQIAPQLAGHTHPGAKSAPLCLRSYPVRRQRPKLTSLDGRHLVLEPLAVTPPASATHERVRIRPRTDGDACRRAYATPRHERTRGARGMCAFVVPAPRKRWKHAKTAQTRSGRTALYLAGRMHTSARSASLRSQSHLSRRRRCVRRRRPGREPMHPARSPAFTLSPRVCERRETHTDASSHVRVDA